ncbi:TetR family transcriptional regulator [Caulobacter sp. SLTY]|uniref:TetR/AcrR family transcriptional regulator n=1 Tax=Caulobacter sp. SLTY TaxID=2683262 RepID=UPI0014123D66|nr:TetR/AcrR family transcriptional regulator [Caulobacter sp. SLTY]NBB15203.1 TetR family transcriptional regulator [Caulobacter sp. SLTY]
MPRKPATDDQRQAARRTLQKAAAGLYAEAGAAAVSARAIAQRAGVSVGTLYAHFGSLQGLMQSLWMEPVEVINAELAQLAAGIDDPIERLRSLLNAYVEVALTRPELFRGAFLFVRPETLPKPERRPLEETPFAALLVAAIREGQASGVVREGDAAELAQMAWAGVHGCLALPINFDRLAFAEPPRLAARMIEMLIADLAAASTDGPAV